MQCRPRQSRSLHMVLVLFAAFCIVSAAAFLPGHVPGIGTGAAAAGDVRDSVDLQFLVVDGDSGSPVANVDVVLLDQNDQQIAQRISDADGKVMFSGVSTTAILTAVAQPTGKYVSFPVDVATFAAQPIRLAVYRSDQQWTTWARTNERLHVGPATGKPTGKPLWSYDARNMLEFPPCLAYGLVIYGSYHGFVNANRQSDGELLWQVYPGTAEKPSKFANQLAVSTWVENGERVARVYFADLTGIVGCLDAFTGNYIWVRDSGKGQGTGGKTLPFKSFEASPLIQGETLFVASRYNKNGGTSGLWALDRRTGEVRWFRKLGATRNSKIGASPAYHTGRLFVAAYDGNLYAVSSSTGKVLWRRKFPCSFYSTPAISGTSLYIGSNSTGMIYCVDTRTGRVKWKRDYGSAVHSSPAVYNGRLFLGIGKRFYAMSASNGRVVWSVPTNTKVWGSATLLKGIVYFSDFGKTYACSASTGKTVWTWKAGRYSPVTATRHLIMVCGRRVMYAFRPSN